MLKQNKLNWAQETVFIRDEAGQVLAEFDMDIDQSGTKWWAMQRYNYNLFGKNIAADITGEDIEQTRAIDIATSRRYYFHDHLGSVRVIANQYGEPVYNFEYWPFGEEFTSSEYNEGTYRYTGQERDYDLDLDYMMSRHYSWKYGRFLQPDPVNGSIGNAQSWNLYSYVQNNPMMFTDPWGYGKKNETAGVNISTVPCYNCKTEEEKKLECEMQGCTWKLGECWCGNVYYGDFAETITITATDEGPIRKAFEESVLKADIFSDWLEFLAYVHQSTMHEGPIAFRPNYNDPAVQIMSMVSQNVQPWLDYGDTYISATLSAIPSNKPILNGIYSKIFARYVFNIGKTNLGGKVVTMGGGLFRYVGEHLAKPGEIAHSRQIELFWKSIVIRFK